MSFAIVTRFRLHDIVVELAAERLELATALEHIFRPFVLADAGRGAGSPPASRTGGDGWRAAVDGEKYIFDDFDAALWALEDAVAERLLKAASDCLLIHGATVSHGDKMLLLVGPSGSGKTTTALELVRRGWLYITDEFTAVEQSAESIRPFPRSATRKFDGAIPAGTSWDAGGRFGFRSHMLPDHRAVLEPLAMKSCIVVFPHFRAQTHPRLRPMPPAEACVRFMPSIFDFEGQEKRIWPTLAKLTARSRAYDFDYGDARTDLDLVVDLFGEGTH